MKTAWKLFAAEFSGTAILVAVGLSCVILYFGLGSPVVDLVSDPGLRRFITGILFGSTGALIAVSPLGKESGAHINPVVTLAFWLKGKIGYKHAITYILAQLAGGIIGAIPLLAWRNMGASISYGATLPEPDTSYLLVILGEVVTTCSLVILLLLFVSHKRLRTYTPLLFPVLYGIMVYLEAPLSGTSTNPARSLGPSVVSGNWTGWWIYWIGPVVGALLGVAVHRYSRLNRLKMEVAKLYHFDHDPHGLFSSWKEQAGNR